MPRTVHKDLCTFMLISLSSLLRITNLSDKSRREIQNTRFMFNNIFLFEIRAVCEIHSLI